MTTYNIDCNSTAASTLAPATYRDPFWQAIQAEASRVADEDSVMKPMLDRTVLSHQTIECALANHLATSLSEHSDDIRQLTRLFAETLDGSEKIRQSIRADLRAVRRNDQATSSYLTPFLNFKGFLALQSYRIAHALWHLDRRLLASYLQGRSSVVYGVDIHPAATIGSGVFIDHATGVVIGETATVGDSVVMLHDVTLGATGKQRGDRHPKIGDHAFIGAGAKLLGNIQIGRRATIGAGSIVLADVPPQATAVGVPAKIIQRGPWIGADEKTTHQPA